MPRKHRPRKYPAGVYVCFNCGERKPLDEMVNKNHRTKYCWNCVLNLIPRGRSLGRKTHIYTVNWKYGVDFIDYEMMLIEQDNKCAICSNDFVDRKAMVDHCHYSNKVRGLLCTGCNTGLGMFRDSVEILTSAASYLSNASNVEINGQ